MMNGWLISGCLFVVLLCNRAETSDPKTWLGNEIASLLGLYTHVHENPELSYQEKETAKRCEAELKKIGIETTPNIGGFGVVGLGRAGIVEAKIEVVR